MSTPSEILDFWYSSPMSEHWFRSTPEIDDTIRIRYEALWEQARQGQLVHWQATPEGCLALCIVLDQFPLNMFRGDVCSFATEQQAVEVSKYALAHGFDQQLPRDKVIFLYVPLMHSEHLADQDESVRCFEALGMEENAWFARHHHGLIQRFGRFPHRNAILGRPSTPAELEYLYSAEAFKG